MPLGTSKGTITKLPVCSVVNEPVIAFAVFGPPHVSGVAARAGPASAR